MLDIPLEQYFKYSKPTTAARIKDHDRINETAYELAVAIKNFTEAIKKIDDEQ